MRYFIDCVFSPLKQKKGYVILLILTSIVAIILAIFASINFSSGFLTIDLSNISYIKFLKGDCGMASMIFSTLFSLMIFFIIIWICHCKPYLTPLSIIFYLYLVYSQTIILVSLIMIYGFFNCIILAMILFIYFLATWFLFVLSITHMSCNMREQDYFRCCFDINRSKFLVTLILIIITTLIFSFTITILKNFIILLVY